MLKFYQQQKHTHTHTVHFMQVHCAIYLPANVINGRRIEVISLKYNLVVCSRASSAKIFSRLLYLSLPHTHWQRKSFALRCVKCVNTILFSYFFFYLCSVFFRFYMYSINCIMRLCERNCRHTPALFISVYLRACVRARESSDATWDFI